MFQIVLLLTWYLHLTSAALFGSPNYYKKGDKVELLLNKVESDNTQLPYSYVDLPFVCPPSDRNKPKRLSIGQILKGDRLWESSYDLKFGMDSHCLRLCDMMLKSTGVAKADSLIKNGYVAHWLLDGLPGATTFVSSNHNIKYYAAGFSLGFVRDQVSYIYNHVMLVIRYNKDKKTGLHSIVGFEVYPKSVSDDHCPGSSKDYTNLPLVLNGEDESTQDSKLRVPYTYSVYWREDATIDYDSRWDLFYENETNRENHKMHWISFGNSLVLVFLLSLVVALVMIRVLRKEFQSSSSYLPLNDVDNNNNWKNLADEVFERPKLANILSILVVSGIQMLFVILGVIIILVVNTNLKISKSTTSTRFFDNHGGAFFSLSVLWFILSGSVAGYVGIIVHKINSNAGFSKPYEKSKTILLSILFSGVISGVILPIVLVFNFFVWAEGSSYALPLGTIIILLFLVLFIQVPLGIIGGAMGNKKSINLDAILHNPKGDYNHGKKHEDFKLRPKRTSGWGFSPIPSVLIFGLVPFWVVYVELLFILNSIWLEKTTFYYMYGFLLTTSIILIVVIAESSIVATYASLAVYNNPAWQWLCFRVGSSIGWYIFGYSIYYFARYLKIRDVVSILLYLGYMGIVSSLVGIVGGAIGIVTGFVFLRRIFGSLKVD